MKHSSSGAFRRRVFRCSFDDHYGLRALDEIGLSNVTFRTDYPHSEATWPDSPKVAERLLRGLPNAVAEQVLWKDGARMLGIDTAQFFHG